MLTVKRLTIVSYKTLDTLKMPTLQDVAKRAGVSTATVSKVLSNTPYFTEETRSKVMKAVEDLGYRPNLAARALSSGRTQIIAVVFPYIYDAIFTDPLVLRILEGIESECTQRGYNILLSTPRLNGSGPDEHYLQLIQSGYIDGIIALDNVPLASVLAPVHNHGMPCVAIGYHETTYSVHSDDISGGHQLMRHILELGHRRVGIITVAEEMNFSINHRMHGLRIACEDAGIDFASLQIATGDFSVRSGIDCAGQLLTDYPDLTALICVNDRMAMGAIQQVRMLGRGIPNDFTVVGYDDIPTAAIFEPPLTTISQQAPELGRNAARILFEVLEGKKPASLKLPTRLIVRESSAVPR